MIRTRILGDLNDTICTKEWLWKCQITNPLSNQTSWDTNRTTPFPSTTAYRCWRWKLLALCEHQARKYSLARPTLFVHCRTHRRLRTNTSRRIKRSSDCYHPRRCCLQFDSDQALRLLCLKGHVRAHGSMLWRHRGQEASEYLCNKTPLLEGIEQPIISPKDPGNAFSDTLLMSRFQKFAADTAKKKTAGCLKLRFARFWFELIRGQRFWEVVLYTGHDTFTCAP